jgi:hypothetical protein
MLARDGVRFVDVEASLNQKLSPKGQKLEEVSNILLTQPPHTQLKGLFTPSPVAIDPAKKYNSPHLTTHQLHFWVITSPSSEPPILSQITRTVRT